MAYSEGMAYNKGMVYNEEMVYYEGMAYIMVRGAMCGAERVRLCVIGSWPLKLAGSPVSASGGWAGHKGAPDEDGACSVALVHVGTPGHAHSRRTMFECVRLPRGVRRVSG